MPSDYKAISNQHWEDYGTKIDRWAPRFLANQYDDRTHFIFELLQNAEDALGKRFGKGSRNISFNLLPTGLRVAHFGKPFEQANVKAICSIGESTKEEDVTTIGKFGIGFKSVYSLTNRPEIHSGDEHFAIESFVHPVEIDPIGMEAEETVFWFPFKENAEEIFAEIQDALVDLPDTTLLFLKNVTGVNWSIEGGAYGSLSRTSKKIGEFVRQTNLKRTQGNEKSTVQRWLVCSRPVSHKGNFVGDTEVAFQLTECKDGVVVQPVSDSRLVAFFPTIVPAKLGFVIQAPFQTTPSRDNIPAKEPWNQHLVGEIAKLLGESLVRLRDLGFLSLELLSALPLNRSDFPVGSMLAPLYDATIDAIVRKPLLPTNEGKWVNAQNSLIARGNDLRKLLKQKQLYEMFGTSGATRWLSDRLTQDRFPSFRQFLTNVIGVKEISPADCIQKWSKEFLESQSDGWIIELYTFLSKQHGLMREPSFKIKPWARMEDGSHIAPFRGDQPNAFLPLSEGESGFPTIRRKLLKVEEVVDFYKRLGLTEPDPVDAAIKYVLPRYDGNKFPEDLQTYSSDIERLVACSKVDSEKQRDKLTVAAKDKQIVRAVDGQGKRFWTMPSNAYLASANMKSLFNGVSGVLLVNDEVECLRGEGVRILLRRLGASSTLDTFSVNNLTASERSQLREGRGYDGQVIDRDVRGLEQLLDHIPTLPFDEAVQRCRMLWDALRDLVRESRESVLYGTYHWSHYGPKSKQIKSYFVRRLRGSAWIPSEDGTFRKPLDSVFELIPGGWPENAALQKALGFKPHIREQLAKEYGLEPEVLDFLAKKGLKTLVQIMEKYGPEVENDTVHQSPISISEAPGTTARSVANSGTSEGGSSVTVGNASTAFSGTHSGNSVKKSQGSSANNENSLGQAYRPNSHAGRTEFFSYVKTHPVDVDEDEFSDSQTLEQRMSVEASAIDHILKLEPELQRTPPFNKGFDLFENDSDGNTQRWVEVKAMVGTLTNHPVGMSKAQFEMAQQKGYQYWLYIVEQATSEVPRILKIQDPAGNARTFTFDEGWREIAMVRQVNVETGEVKV